MPRKPTGRHNGRPTLQETTTLSELTRRSKLSIAALYPHALRQAAKELDSGNDVPPELRHDTTWRIIEHHDGKPKQTIAGDPNAPLQTQVILRTSEELALLEKELDYLQRQARLLEKYPPLKALPLGQTYND